MQAEPESLFLSPRRTRARPARRQPAHPRQPPQSHADQPIQCLPAWPGENTRKKRLRTPRPSPEKKNEMNALVNLLTRRHGELAKFVFGTSVLTGFVWTLAEGKPLVDPYRWRSGEGGQEGGRRLGGTVGGPRRQKVKRWHAARPPAPSGVTHGPLILLPDDDTHNTHRRGNRE